MKRFFFILLKLNFIVISAGNTVYASEQSYSGRSIYKYFLEPLLGIDELLQSDSNTFTVTHCEFINPEDQTQQYVYEGLGSCLYEAIPFTKEEDADKQQIHIHILIDNTQEFTLILSWNSLSIFDIFSFYWNKTLSPLANRLTLTAASPHTLSDVLNHFLKLENTAVANIRSLNIDELQIDMKPYRSDEEKTNLVTLIALEDSQIVYTIEIITNYYPGNENFFIASKDQYEVSTNNETH